MAVPVTQLHILRLLLQVERNLSGLQYDMRANAATWKQQAQAQTVPVAQLAGYMDSAAAAYQTRLGWLDAAQANSDVWTKLAAMWALLGGTGKDFQDLITPFKAVADGLGPASKNTNAKIIGICDQILSTIDAPLSLWPE